MKPADLDAMLARNPSLRIEGMPEKPVAPVADPAPSKEDMKREREIQDDIVDYLHLRGFVVGKSDPTRKSTYTTSWPDLTICVHGRAVGLELKVPGKDATKEQSDLHYEMRRNGWSVYVVHGVEEVKMILDDLEDK